MNERSLFLTARDKSTPAERLAYLDEACAGDTALRGRVEALLESHEQAGDFLGKPAPLRLAEELAARTGPGQTLDESLPAGGAALDFLAPSTRPDSLGRLGR